MADSCVGVFERHAGRVVNRVAGAEQFDGCGAVEAAAENHGRGAASGGGIGRHGGERNRAGRNIERVIARRRHGIAVDHDVPCSRIGRGDQQLLVGSVGRRGAVVVRAPRGGAPRRAYTSFASPEEESNRLMLSGSFVGTLTVNNWA